MIPSEVANIAELIWPGWVHLDEDESLEGRTAMEEILSAAYRIYNAGYRVGSPTND